MSEIDLDDLREKAEAATPGPWRVECVEADQWWAIYGHEMVCPDDGDGTDADYIAAANPAVVLALIERVEKAEEAAQMLTESYARLEKAERKRDALAATVERVRALPLGPKSGGFFMVSMREIVRALDGEASC